MEQDESVSKNNPQSGPRDTARRMRHWRTEAGLRPVDLARALDMSEASISRWESENSDKEPNTKTIRRIAEICGVSLAIFWGRLPEEVG